MRLSMPRDRYYLVILFAVGLAFIPLAAQAKLDGSDYAVDALASMKQINTGWTQLFNDTFFNQSSSTIWTIMRSFAQFIMGIASIFFIMRIIKEMAQPQARWNDIIAAMSVLFLMIYLIGGTASPGLRLIGDSLQIKNYFLTSFMQQTIAGVKINEAITDSILDDDAKSQISQKQKICEQIVAPPVFLPSATRPAAGTPITNAQDAVYRKIQCFQDLANWTDTLKSRYMQGLCNGGSACINTMHFINDYKDALVTAIQNEQTELVTEAVSGSPAVAAADAAAHVLLTTASFSSTHAFFEVVKMLMHVFQYMFSFAINTIYFLSILTFSVSVAWSIVPFTPNNPLKYWGGIFFGTMLAEFYYTIMVGISAVILSKLPTTSFGDIITAMIYGLGAPVASTWLAKGNAAGAVSGMSAGFGQVAQAIPIVGGLASGLTRFRK